MSRSENASALYLQTRSVTMFRSSAETHFSHRSRPPGRLPPSAACAGWLDSRLLTRRADDSRIPKKIYIPQTRSRELAPRACGGVSRFTNQVLRAVADDKQRKLWLSRISAGNVVIRGRVRHALRTNELDGQSAKPSSPLTAGSHSHHWGLHSVQGNRAGDHVFSGISAHRSRCTVLSR